MRNVLCVIGLVFLLWGNASFADTLKCGLGTEESNLKLVKTARLDRGSRQVTLRFDDPNDEGIRYYQAKIYFNYEGRRKDVIELILQGELGHIAIGSHKVKTVEEGDAYSIYLVAKRNSYLQMLCVVK